MTNEDFLTVQDIADYLNVKRLVVYELLKKREMEHYKIGRQLRVPKSEFERYLNDARRTREPVTGRD